MLVFRNGMCLPSGTDAEVDWGGGVFTQPFTALKPSWKDKSDI